MGARRSRRSRSSRRRRGRPRRPRPSGCRRSRATATPAARRALGSPGRRARSPRRRGPRGARARALAADVEDVGALAGRARARGATAAAASPWRPPSLKESGRDVEDAPDRGRACGRAASAPMPVSTRSPPAGFPPSAGGPAPSSAAVRLGRRVARRSGRGGAAALAADLVDVLAPQDGLDLLAVSVSYSSRASATRVEARRGSRGGGARVSSSASSRKRWISSSIDLRGRLAVVHAAGRPRGRGRGAPRPRRGRWGRRFSLMPHLRDHEPGDLRRLLDVVLGAARDVVADDLLGDAAAEAHLEAGEQLLPAWRRSGPAPAATSSRRAPCRAG